MSEQKAMRLSQVARKLNVGRDTIVEFLDEQEQFVDKVIEGSRTQVLFGYMQKFRCKNRGHGIAVFIPIAKWKKKEEKEE